MNRYDREKEIKSRFDVILDRYEMFDFIVITGKVGGDVITYRIYDNGEVIE